MSRRAGAWMLSATVVGLALRLWVALPAAPQEVFGDEGLYWRASAAILETGDPGSSFHPPLYPYALSLARGIAGDSRSVARSLNVLAFVFAAAALFVLARSGRSAGNAILPMVVLSLHPLLVAAHWPLQYVPCCAISRSPLHAVHAETASYTAHYLLEREPTVWS